MRACSVPLEVLRTTSHVVRQSSARRKGTQAAEAVDFPAGARRHQRHPALQYPGEQFARTAVQSRSALRQIQ